MFEPGRAAPGVGGGRRSRRSSSLALLGAARLPRLLRPLAAGAIAVAGLRARAARRRRAPTRSCGPSAGARCSGGSAAGSRRCPASTCPTAASTSGRMLVLGVGGTLLAVAAAVLAFWPRRGGRTGFRAAALILLVALYAVPAVVLDFEGEFLRGALLAVLVLAFLRLERLAGRRRAGRGDRRRRRRGRRAARRAGCSTGASRGGTTSAGRSTPPRARAVGFSWDHDYSPLDWPRDGREMLRVKARQAAYWKAQRPRPLRRRRLAPGPAAAQRGRRRAAARRTRLAPRRWTQQIEVTLRNLRVRHVRHGRDRDGGARRGRATRSAAASSPRPTGSARATPTRPTSTRRARPSGSCATRSTDYEDWLRAYRSVILPAAARTPTFPATIMTWPGFDDRGGPGGGAARRGPVRPGARARAARPDLGARAASSRRGRTTPFEYIEADRGAPRPATTRYSERPPAGRPHARRLPVRRQGRLLPAVLGRGGAAAADGRGARRAWPPASRPARSTRTSRSTSCATSTRTPGSRSGSPSFGWVQRDPTPAAAPPRSQPGEARGGVDARAASRGAPDLGGERLSQLDEGRALAQDDGRD